MGNSNAIGDSKQKSLRKGILKKAAILATVAAVTGAAATAQQKAQKSEALVGLIFTVVSTVVGTVGSIAGGIAGNNAERRQAEEERRRQEEEERQARIREALESAEHNVRLQETEEDNVNDKKVDISVSDNSAIIEENSLSQYSSRTNLNRPKVVKGINTGGFGVTAEEETKTGISEIEEVDEILDEVIDDTVEEIETEDEEVDNKYGDLNAAQSTPSNIVRFTLDDLELEDDYSDSIDTIYEEVFAHGVGVIGNNENIGEDNYLEIDESLLMSEDEAKEHPLVQQGIIDYENLILLDFGMRNGTIDGEILSMMYESGEITEECHNALVEMMESINSEE